jgi:hypothetical protein
MSPISGSFVVELNFSAFFALHCWARTFTNFIPKGAKCDKKTVNVDEIAVPHYQNGWST